LFDLGDNASIRVIKAVFWNVDILLCHHGNFVLAHVVIGVAAAKGSLVCVGVAGGVYAGPCFDEFKEWVGRIPLEVVAAAILAIYILHVVLLVR